MLIAYQSLANDATMNIALASYVTLHIFVLCMSGRPPHDKHENKH